MDHQILNMLTFPVFKNCPLLCMSLFSCSQCSIIDKYFLSTFYMSDILEALGIQGGDKVWIHPTWVKKYFNLTPFQIVLLVTIWICYSLAWNWLFIIYKVKPNLNPNVYETRFLSTFLVFLLSLPSPPLSQFIFQLYWNGFILFTHPCLFAMLPICLE